MTVSQIPPGSDVIPDQYTVLFDETADLAFHLEDVQDFIDENKQCATINNTILLRFDKSFFKFYSGKFDEGLLNFISTSQGVSAIIPVQNVPDNDTSLPAEPLPADNHTEARSNIIEARRTGATWVGDDARITIEIYQHSPGIGADYADCAGGFETVIVRHWNRQK